MSILYGKDRGSIKKKTKGVKETEVLFNSSKAKVTFDESIVESEDIKLVIERLGYKVLGEK